jgi:hypothetical protein
MNHVVYLALWQLLNLDRTEGEALSADEINAAHQQMLAKGLDTPYSSAAIIGRANVLDGARDALLGGSSSYELAWHIDSPNAGGYLALLTEVPPSPVSPELDASTAARNMLSS